MLTFVLLSEVALTWAELGSTENAIASIAAAVDITKNTQDALARGLCRVFLETLRIESEDPKDIPSSIAAVEEELRIMGSASLLAISALDVQARGYLRLGQIPEAEAAARQASRAGQQVPAYEPAWRATLIRVLLTKGESAAALDEATSALQLLTVFECLGNAEVELRLAISEAFDAAGDRGRAQEGLRVAMRQIQIRADDIAEPLWKGSYLTRNPYCVRVEQLAKQWGLT